MKEDNKDEAVVSVKIMSILRRILVCLLILIFGITVTAVLGSLEPELEQRTEEELARSLICLPVKEQNVRLTLSGYGTAKPNLIVQISSQVGGKVVYERPCLEAGCIVPQGEVILRIDPRDYEIQLRNSQAELKRLRSEYAIVKRSIDDLERELLEQNKVLALTEEAHKRNIKLFAKKVISESQYENSQKAFALQRSENIRLKGTLAQAGISQEAIDSQIEKSLADIDKAKIDLERCTIASPFTGRIDSLNVRKDSFVKVGDKLFEIFDDSNIEVAIDIDALKITNLIDLKDILDDQYIAWFRDAGNIPAEVNWADRSDKDDFKTDGRIVRIERFNERSRTFTMVVKPEYKSGQKPILANMFCRVTIFGRTVNDVFVVPRLAIQLDGNVFVADEDSCLRSRNIEIINSSESGVVVRGLKRGDELLMQRLPRDLVAGTKVKILRPDSKSPLWHYSATPENELQAWNRQVQSINVRAKSDIKVDARLSEKQK